MRLPSNVKYRAVMIRKPGNSSPLTYYFDKDMVEVGYTVEGMEGFFTQTAGREWSEYLMNYYRVTEVR